MQANGLVALRCWPVSVELGKQIFTIPPQPALAWIIPIVDQDWLGIVPDLIDPADFSINDLLLSQEVRIADCVDAARDAVSTATGMPWWSAARLVLAVHESPDLTGELVICNVDAEVVSIGAFVQATYRILVREADKKQRAKIDAELQRPPAGIGVEKRYDPAVAANLFEQMARSRGLPAQQ